jgi:GntR family transcriptional regulator of arabinose operon
MPRSAHNKLVKPMYVKIRERLAREIASGRYAPGEKFPSEAALGRRFAASRITVGRAVRELQEQGLLDRVAGSGTYVRDPSPRVREGLLFGLVIPNLGETEIFEPICQGIAAAPAARGHALLWAHAARAASREKQAVELARQSIARGVAGVFFAPLEFSKASAEVNARVMRMLESEGIAVVLLDRRTGESGPRRACDLVGIDNHRAGYIAAEHLLRTGSRRVGFVRIEGQANTVKERVRGYRDALAEFGLEPEVFTMPAERGWEPDGAALRCDGFVCANDRIAGRCMQALGTAGRRVPEDMRIVGIDDVHYATLLPVPLTTVRQPCREIGETAMGVMLERLAHPKMPARDVLLDCTLVIRESSRVR